MMKHAKFRTLAAVIPALLSAAPAAAEGGKPVAVPPGFIPLPPREPNTASGMQALPSAAPRFIALGPHNFKAVLRPGHTSDALQKSAHATEAALMPHEAPAHSGHEIMSREKAQQIISIFEPDR
jgi:hypothetical protein